MPIRCAVLTHGGRREKAGFTIEPGGVMPFVNTIGETEELITVGADPRGTGGWAQVSSPDRGQTGNISEIGPDQPFMHPDRVRIGIHVGMFAAYCSD